MHKTMTLMTREQMEQIPTPRLLAYRNSLLRVPEGADDDQHGESRMNKTTPAWQNTYQALREILAGREHVER